jgi:hypothetical protein
MLTTIAPPPGFSDVPTDPCVLSFVLILAIRLTLKLHTYKHCAYLHTYKYCKTNAQTLEN